MNELDRIRLEAIKSMPEMIRRVGDWEVVACCAACWGEISTGSHLLYKHKWVSEEYDSAGYITARHERPPDTCPHCPEVRRIDESTEKMHYGMSAGRERIRAVYHPLPYVLKRRRLVVTEQVMVTRTRGFLWWKTEERYVAAESGVWEEEILREGDLPQAAGQPTTSNQPTTDERQ